MINKFSRKKFLQTSGLATTGLLLNSNIFSMDSSVPKIKAIAFDAFPIFDPRPIFKTVSELIPEKGKQVTDVWLSKQFSYQWLRFLGNKYKNFWDITKDALDFSLAQFDINLSENDKNSILKKYETITVWPDVIPALELLKKENIKLGFLSNMTKKMLDQGIQNSNTKDFFDFVISTDEKQTYKPSPAAYQMAIDKLQLKKEEILFAAFAGWDMAGAKWFGYPTFWVNRMTAPIEKLDAVPDGVANNLNELVQFVTMNNARNSRTN
ncbi:MAG: haloacid dehalogenase type II [Bacteroidetes bacterium]|nr:haloacid dehalogenase type II [Bacteroidota bacterium]